MEDGVVRWGEQAAETGGVTTGLVGLGERVTWHGGGEKSYNG
jgi:hypothetical protein